MSIGSYNDGTFNGPSMAGGAAPSGGDPLDLTTVSACTAALAAGNVTLNAAQSAVLPMLITAASREIQKELHRIIPAADYDEILTPTQGRPDRGIPATVNLSRYPVNTTDTLRVSSGRTTALTVTNTDASGNQVARVAFTTTGDPELQLSYTGLQLTTIASGVVTRSPLAWPVTSPLMTLDALAAAVNGLGNGWSAAVTGKLGGWPTTELVGAREPKGAFSPGLGLDVFATDLQSYSIDRASGLLSIGYATAGGGWFGGGFGGYPGSSWGDCDDETTAFGGIGYDQVRVTYNAGYAAVPAVYQEFAAEVVKVMLERLETNTLLQSETAAAYSWAARTALQTTALASIMTSLQKYKDWSL